MRTPRAARICGAAVLLLAVLASLGPQPAAAGNCGIFVSPSGTDGPTSGLTPSDPCLTINYAISRAQTEGLTCVFVQAGTYNEAVVLQSGIDVIGGFDANWSSGSHTVSAYQAVVTGGYWGGRYVGIEASGLAAPTLVQEMVIDSPPASTPGASSYGVHAVNSNLSLSRLTIEAGPGAAGVAGSAGADASMVNATAGMNGGNGGSGNQYSTTCDNTSRGAGGSAGTNPSAISGRSPVGGAGGSGGTMDTDCSLFSPNFNARAGDPGQPAAFVYGSAGLGGAGGGGTSICGPGQAGQPGLVTNGISGPGGNGGTVVSQDWMSAPGGAGGIGENGSGGGGGGGAGGCDNGTDSYGAGGGGGGAGGARAVGGGAGGGGGGASICVLAAGSTLGVTECELVRGAAGNGGQGGTGGRGQDGGAGGAGGFGAPNGSAGGTGGNGAHGGHGGGGGGGAGGSSYGIVAQGGSLSQSQNVFSGGLAGTGGGGGLSAPAAPVQNRDGNNGAAGTSDTVGTVLTLPGPQPIAGAAALPAHAAGVAAACDPSPCLGLAVPPGSGTHALAFAGAVPNPSVHGAVFRFSLPDAGEVTIEVFDVRGRRIGTAVRGGFAPGDHAATWNGHLASGGRVSAGVYFARFSAEGRVIVRRFTLLE